MCNGVVSYLDPPFYIALIPQKRIKSSNWLMVWIIFLLSPSSNKIYTTKKSIFQLSSIIFPKIKHNNKWCKATKKNQIIYKVRSVHTMHQPKPQKTRRSMYRFKFWLYFMKSLDPPLHTIFIFYTTYCVKNGKHILRENVIYVYLFRDFRSDQINVRFKSMNFSVKGIVLTFKNWICGHRGRFIFYIFMK